MALKEKIDPTKHYKIEGECWIWLGAKNKKGYGVYTVRVNQLKTKTFPAHKFVYEQLVGKVPEGMHLDHLKEKCHSRACINPAHLEPVTVTENTRRSSLTTLDKDKVAIIKRDLKTHSKEYLAMHFNVSKACITDIALGRRWADIEAAI